MTFRLQQRLEVAVGQVLALGCEEHGLHQYQPQERQDEVTNRKFLLGRWHVFLRFIAHDRPGTERGWWVRMVRWRAALRALLVAAVPLRRAYWRHGHASDPARGLG